MFSQSTIPISTMVPIAIAIPESATTLASTPATFIAIKQIKTAKGSSPASAARYPVEWQLRTPVGTYALRALLDAQELDSRGSTGTVYWEGLSELLDTGDRRVGLGYLEMTGYAVSVRPPPS